jgi:hypothetical protein
VAFIRAVVIIEATVVVAPFVAFVQATVETIGIVVVAVGVTDFVSVTIVIEVTATLDVFASPARCGLKNRKREI